MSTVADERAAEDEAVTPRLRTTGRRVVFWVVIGVVVLLVAGALTVLGRSASVGVPLAADNAGPGGSMALVEVLKQQGVSVTATSTLQDTADAVGDAEQTTILLYDPAEFLDQDKLEELGTLADRIIVVDPYFVQLHALAPDVAREGPVDGPLTADCSVPAVRKAETVSGDLVGFRISDGGSGAIGCLESDDGVYSVVQANDRVTVLGAVGALTNGQIAQDGNAALTLNLLGEHEALIWYLPSFEDLDSGTPPPPSPPWLVPALFLLLLTGIGAAFWRGRRLGPLVVENLPVTVRASETMLGRARLYEKSGARLRALDALRVGTVQRIAKLAKLSRHATLDEIVTAAAALTGRPPSELQRLLVDDVPGTDADLVRRSDELLTLEQEVARAVRGT